MCKISCSCLSLTLSSLLSVGAKSHVSTASGCVDSFTNRNVKRHTQGGLRDKGGGGGAERGRKQNKHGPQKHKNATLKHLGWVFNYIGYATLSAIVSARRGSCSILLGFIRSSFPAEQM